MQIIADWTCLNALGTTSLIKSMAAQFRAEQLCHGFAVAIQILAGWQGYIPYHAAHASSSFDLHDLDTPLFANEQIRSFK